MKVTKDQAEKAEALYQELVSRAWESEEFKQRLIADPKAVIAEVSGDSTFKGGVEIVVEDQTNPDVVYINIPHKVTADNFELSEEELEMVAGGGTSQNGWNPIKWIGTGLAAAYEFNVAVISAGIDLITGGDEE